MTNGSRFCALVLVMASSSWAAPNVEITNLQVDPETPQTADSFRVNVKIINTGDQPIEGICTVEIIQDGMTVTRGATSADMLQRDIVATSFKNGVWVSPSAFILKQPGRYTARAIWSGGNYRATKEQAFTCTGVDVSIVRNPNPFLSASDLRQTAQRLWQEKAEQAEQARQDQIRKQQEEVEAARQAHLRQQQAEQERRDQVEKARQDKLRQEREAAEQARQEKLRQQTEQARLEKLRKDAEAADQARLEKARQQAAEEARQTQALKQQQAEQEARQRDLRDKQAEQERQAQLRKEQAAAELARQQKLREQQAEEARQEELRKQQQAAEEARQERVRQQQAEQARQQQMRRQQEQEARAQWIRQQQEALAQQQYQNELRRQQAQQEAARQTDLRNQQAMALIGIFAQANQQREAREERERLERQQAELEAQQRETAAQQELLASGDNTITFRVKNNTRKTVHVQFYTLDGNGVWPSKDRVWVQDDRGVHEYKLQAKNGEKIYYGAWYADDPNRYWGAGKDNAHSDGTYYTCDGGQTPIIGLDK